MRIFHIIPSGIWADVQGDAVYRGDTLDSEGFIHFSTRDQVIRVANARFVGHNGLLMLEIETEKLNADLKFEPPYEGATGDDAQMLFPHLYGALNLDAVVAVHDFEPNVDGMFSLPATVM